MRVRLLKYFIYRSIGYLLLLLIFCEFTFYYLVQWNCSWPILDPKNADPAIEYNGETPVKVMVLADTHLLGARNGHWFDKLRREWQMHRAFQTAMTLHQPELVFILGDITDEGLWCSEAEFQSYVKRFYKLFAVPDGTKMYVVVGNHDIGFHYGISPYLNQRFVSAFDAPAVRLVSLRGVHFVLVNSMALEGDGCFLCRPAEQQLQHIEARLKCTKGIRTCAAGQRLQQFSRPIVMQHFPMYRENDAVCDSGEVDIAPAALRAVQYRERWDCLSREASHQLLDSLRPRLVVAGHTHYGCRRQLPAPFHTLELTVPSFSWRNHPSPNYMLAVFTANNLATARCEMPQEITVKMVYTVGVLTLAVWFATADFPGDLEYIRTKRLGQHYCGKYQKGTVRIVL